VFLCLVDYDLQYQHDEIVELLLHINMFDVLSSLYMVKGVLNVYYNGVDCSFIARVKSLYLSLSQNGYTLQQHIEIVGYKKKMLCDNSPHRN